MCVQTQDGRFTCPNCSDSFDDHTGLKIHYSSVHGASEGYPWDVDGIDGIVTLTCEWCSGEYERRPSQADGSRFCSRTCQMEYQTANGEVVNGEDHGKWKGGVSSLRNGVFERDNYTCQRCGKTVERDRESSDTGHAHHLIPVSAGGPDVPENVVTLCEMCHSRHTTI